MFLLIQFLLVVGFSSAQTFNRQPVNEEIQVNGYTRFPILQCPATNESIKDFRKKLDDLKKAIKEKAKCGGIEADVAGLTSLITDQRAMFLNLVTKGQSEGLTDREQSAVENYVSSLVVKTSNLLSVLTGQDACFDEDKKGTSVEFITSLIGEGSKILSIIGGPQVGGTIQIASEVLTGFIKAMKTIEETSQGYNFKIAEQRNAYAESLCSLFDYRRELEGLMEPYDSVERLHSLEKAINSQLRKIQSSCPECAQMISEVHQAIAIASQRGVIEIDRMDQVWTPLFEEYISQKALEIDTLYTRRVGTHTYRSLKTITWIPIRIQSIEHKSLKADLGLEDILSEMDNIERFMLDRQAGPFVKQLIREADEWNSKFESLFTSGMFLAMRMNVPMIYAKGIWPNFNARYGALLESMEVFAERSNVPAQKRAIKTFFRKHEKLSHSMNVAIDVANMYCNFFANADWYLSEASGFLGTSIYDECSSDKLRTLNENALLYSNYRSMMPSSEGDKLPLNPKAEDIEVTADWVESLTRTVQDMSNRSDYVIRNSPQPAFGPQ